MFRFLKYRNDWVQVWNDDANWHSGNPSETTGRCWYMIDWSESRGKFRLRTSGKLPSQHGYYKVALDKLTKLNLDVLNDISSVRDKKLKSLGI